MKRKILSLITTLLLTLGVVSTGCSNTNTSSSSMPDTTTTSSHEHTYSSSYEYDDTYHWHPSTCGHDVQGDKGRHEFTSETSENGDTVYTCSICHYSYFDGNNDDKDTYTVTWKNYDGTILEIDNDVSYGTTPTYDGATPIKESDDRYNYNFAGWSPEVEPVTEDITYTAVFTSEEITYTIDFDLNGGTSSSYKGSIEVTTFSKDIFFFDCVKEDWQFRGWEYNGEKIFDEKGNQLKNVTLVDNMIFRAIYSQTVKLTITTNMPEAGTITGEGEYPYNTYVDVSVTPNQGYKFVGWYYQNTLLSNEENYKYMMWDIDVTLEARFEKEDFNLRIYSNNEDYGLVLLKSDSIIDDYLPEYTSLKKYGSEVTIAAYSKSDVRFLGWYDENNNLVTTNAVYTFVMPNYDYTLEAKWNYFTINYNLNGGVNNPNNPSYYTTDDGNIYLQNPTKEGYEFVEWKYNDEIIDTIDVKLVQDITLEAVWSEYEYEIREDDNGKYAVIIGYDDSITDVIIPENVILNGEEIPVKEISQTAFKNNQKVKSVTVSNKVTTIDEYAFAGCTSLESIYIPVSVTSIGSRAFYNCSNLTTVTISENSQLTSIGSSAFSGCSSLASIYIPNSVTTIGDYAFRNCSNLTIYCEVDSKLEGWSNYWNDSNRPVIWNSYKGILGNLNGLEYIAYHDSEGNPYIVITEYNGSAANVVIPEYIEVNGEQIVVKEINDKAFYDNDTIKSVTIPNSVTTINSHTFYSCSNLTIVTIGENSQLTTIGDHAFYNCSKLKTVTISENSQLTTIEDYAFYNCSSLTSIFVPNSVTTIGSSAFRYCSSLTSIYIPDGVTTIGEYAFYNCSSLTTVTISENSQLTSIGSYAFYNCSSLTSIYIPDSVTSIGDYAFSICSSLTSIYIPDGVTTIGDHAFYSCFKLTIYCEISSKPGGWDYYWNYSDRPIAWNSYLGVHDTLNGLEYAVCIDDEGKSYIVITGYNGSNSDVVIPEYIEVNGEQIVVKEISNSAFENAPITSIYIPDSVTTIGEDAFYSLFSSLTIYCEASSKPSDWSSSWNSSNQPVVWNSYLGVHDTLNGLGYAVCIDDEGKSYIVITGYNGSNSDVVIPEYIEVNGEQIVVKEISNSAFDYAPITSIYIPDSVTTIGEDAFYSLSSLTIYCEASSKPSDWSSSWNSSNQPVVWNCIGFEITDEGLYFAVALDDNGDKYITIADYTGSSTNVVIPSSINVDGENIPVKAIASKAFYNNDAITSITISDSVTTIGDYAFYNCSSLESVTISENSQLTTIGSYTFYNCPSLTSIYIPGSVTSIGDYAFYNCSSLTSLYIPDGVTTIGDYAFYNCSNLTTVTISENSQLTTIGDYAYSGCISLASIYIPNSVISIGSYAFRYCYNLTIYCETSSEPSGWYSYWNDSNRPVIWNSYKGIYGNLNGLEYIAYHDSEGNPYIVITGYNGSAANIVIPEYIEVNGEQIVVKVINDKAFYDNDTITSITIPDSVTTIGKYAFYNCSSLTSIYIPDSVTTIGHYAFEYCSKLTIYCETSSKPSGWYWSWNYSNQPVVWDCEDYGITVEGIHYVVLIDEENIKYITIIGYTGSSTNVVIPSSINVNGEDISVKAIADKAFYDNDTITSVTISDSVTTIGSSAFEDCSNLTTVTFGENSQLTSIGFSAFSGSSSLTSIYIPDSVTTIGYSAFSGCSNLTSIYIPDSVTTIGSSAFEDCSNLTIYCEASSKPSDWSSSWNSSNQPVVWNSYLGVHDTLNGLEYAVCIDDEGKSYIVITGYNGSNSDVVIPEYIEVNGEQIVVKEISNSAFSNAQITSIYIPDSVTSIGKYAFYNCSSLTSIYIPDSVTTIESFAFSGCSKLTIYCETSSNPGGWNYGWNYSDRPVVWNCTYEEYLDTIA